MKGMWPKIGWALVGIALLVSFVLDFANTAEGGAIDLRNRITGIRLLEHGGEGIDAYRYKWQSGEPAEFCDLYNNPNLPVNKTTVTPMFLALHLPLAWMPYRLAQMIWFLAQWVLLLGTAWLWMRACASPAQKLSIGLFVVGFTYTAAWRLHCERGQAYIVLAFLFSRWLQMTVDTRRGDRFVAGCLAGFLATLRPSFLILVPFLALHRRGQLVGAGVGLALGLGLPLLINPASWWDYFSAMQAHSELYRQHFDPLPDQQVYPARIEGIPTDILGKFSVIPFADFSVYVLLQWLGFESFPAWPVFLLAVVPFACWLWASRTETLTRLLPGLAAWFFLADFFLPAYRNSYNDVLILDVVLLGIASQKKFPWTAWPCVLALPVGWAIYGFAPETKWIINLPTASFTVGALTCVLLPSLRSRTAN